MSFRHTTALKMVPAPRLELECPVCRYHISPDSRDGSAEALGFLLLGEKKYGVCSGCYQDVPRYVQSRQYKVRWGRRYRQELCRRLLGGK